MSVKKRKNAKTPRILRKSNFLSIIKSLKFRLFIVLEIGFFPYLNIGFLRFYNHDALP